MSLFSNKKIKLQDLYYLLEDLSDLDVSVLIKLTNSLTNSNSTKFRENLLKFAEREDKLSEETNSKFYYEGEGDRHNWPNPLDLDEGEKVKCLKCGLEGKIQTVLGVVGVLVEESKKCDINIKHAALQPKYIQIVSPLPPEFGLKLLDIYKTVPCPTTNPEHLDKPWVMSPTKGEPVRVLRSEYREVDIEGLLNI